MGKYKGATPDRRCFARLCVGDSVRKEMHAEVPFPRKSGAAGAAAEGIRAVLTGDVPVLELHHRGPQPPQIDTPKIQIDADSS
jgi:hypothetical protein